MNIINFYFILFSIEIKSVFLFFLLLIYISTSHRSLDACSVEMALTTFTRRRNNKKKVISGTSHSSSSRFLSNKFHLSLSLTKLVSDFRSSHCNVPYSLLMCDVTLLWVAMRFGFEVSYMTMRYMIEMHTQEHASIN